MLTQAERDAIDWALTALNDYLDNTDACLIATARDAIDGLNTLLAKDTQDSPQSISTAPTHTHILNAECLANARLIASAPDLLAALQFYANPENHEVFPDEANAIGNDSGELAREAIRKALGESHGS